MVLNDETVHIGGLDFHTLSVERQEALVAAVVELATESPDFTYTAPTATGACVYQVDERPSCLIGRAFAQIGFTTAELAAFDVGIYGDTGADVILEALDADSQVYQWCSRVQIEQDRGRLWSDAIAEADAKVGRPFAGEEKGN